jgi:hypothetical protein
LILIDNGGEKKGKMFLPSFRASIELPARKIRIMLKKITQKTLIPALFLIASACAMPAGAQTAASPATNWQSSATLGVTLARGNSDTTLVSLTLGSEKKWAHSDLQLGADDFYGESKNTASPIFNIA